MDQLMPRGIKGRPVLYGVVILILVCSNTLESARVLHTNLASISFKTDEDHAQNSTSNSSIGISSSGANNNTEPHAYELQSTINNYTWETNTSRRWIPPKDVPVLLPIEIRQIFLSENTAWIGDSTARQDYQTMYHVIYTSSEHETNKTLDMQTQNLNKYINRGKRAVPKVFYCAARQEHEGEGDGWNELAQVKGADTNCSGLVPENNQTWAYFALDDGKGKFDYLRRDCTKDILDWVTKRQDFLRQHYSVLVVANGIWEVVRPNDCKKKIEVPVDGTNTTVSQVIPSSQVLKDLLNALSELSGPSFFVVFKLFGPSLDQRNKENNTIYKDLTSAARDWFTENSPPYMDIVDFDKAIKGRTFGENRISGDLKAHWGLEARLLSIQMIADVVERKQIRAGIGN